MLLGKIVETNHKRSSFSSVPCFLAHKSQMVYGIILGVCKFMSSSANDVNNKNDFLSVQFLQSRIEKIHLFLNFLLAGEVGGGSWVGQRIP